MKTGASPEELNLMWGMGFAARWIESNQHVSYTGKSLEERVLEVVAAISCKEHKAAFMTAFGD